MWEGKDRARTSLGSWEQVDRCKVKTCRIASFGDLISLLGSWICPTSVSPINRLYVLWLILLAESAVVNIRMASFKLTPTRHHSLHPESLLHLSLTYTANRLLSCDSLDHPFSFVIHNLQNRHGAKECRH